LALSEWKFQKGIEKMLLKENWEEGYSEVLIRAGWPAGVEITVLK
jgi:hypothetical protein